MKINKKYIAKITSLLVISLLFIMLNYIIAVVIGGFLSKNILQDEYVRQIVQLIKDSKVDYSKINIIMRSEMPQPMFSFFIFAFILNTFVVSVYSFIMAIMKKLFHLNND